MQYPIQTDRKILVTLLVLSAIPVLSGAARFASLATEGSENLENLHYLANPLPIAVHMGAYAVFCVLGAFQIAPVFRRAHMRLHRLIGRVLVPLGLAAAVSGIGMTLSYPPALPNGETVGYVRIAFGFGMILCLLFASVGVRRRDIAAHSLWMLRAYAIALGASTQALVAIPWFLLIGAPQGWPWALAMLLAWGINLGVAEWFARRHFLPTAPPISTTWS